MNSVQEYVLIYTVIVVYQLIFYFMSVCNWIIGDK